MSSVIPVHQISSDEDEEESDLACRVSNALSENFSNGILSSSNSAQLFLPRKTTKSNYLELKNISTKRDFNSLSDEELPDLGFSSISSTRKKVSNPEEFIENIISKPVVNPVSGTSKTAKTSLKDKEAILLEKEAKKRERERKREEKERLKRGKENERLMKRATKPGECLKYIVVQVDRQLLERSEGSEIVSKMLTLELQYRATEQNIPNSITYLRKDPLTGEEQDEKEIVIILMIEDFLSLVHNQIYGPDSDLSSDTFCNRCAQWLNCSYDSKVTVVVCGLEEFYKSQKSKSRKTFRENLTKETGKPSKRKKTNEDNNYLTKVTRIDVETALVSVQVEHKINVRLFESPSKIADFVGQVAKSIAERPYKLDKTSNDFTWYAESSNSNCVKIDKNGEGLLKLWHQQIRQFTNVGPETAQAIAKQYPSPQCLFKVYREVSESEGTKLLADIPVRRGVGVLANTRKVGIELSKKIYKFFMEEDPEIFL